MNTELKKQLGLLDVFCIASGAMISSGLFVLPGIASAGVGPALFLSYIIASLISIPTILSKAELVTAMPKAGGDYFYISRSMGYAVGTVGGLSSWFSLSLKSVFALIGMAAYLELVAPIPIKPVALVLCLFFVFLNILGVKEAARAQNFLVLGLLALLIFYISIGFLHIHIGSYVPFAPFGLGSIFAAAGMVFISYGGVTKIASVAEEVKNPARNVPLGMLLSLIIVGVIYALVVFVTTGLVPAEKLHSSLTPISQGAHTFLGFPGEMIMVVAAFLAFISTANAGIISSSRYPMAMSRDGLLPKFITGINKRFSTPHYSIGITGLFMVLALLFLELEFLVKVASTLLILLYISANLAVIIMRESKLQNYQPKFRSPLYPWVQILGILGCITLLLQMGGQIISLSAFFIAGGFLWYLLYAGTTQIREFGLIHVIERILNRELTSGALSRELKGIVKERDDIVEDRFDHIIEEGVILDLDGPLDRDEFFSQVSSFLSKDLGVSEDRLKRLLIKREEESSTIIRKGLAIPHIIVEGEHKFKMLLARAKNGVIFPNTPAPVHIIFVMAGTKDERNFYLRALAAIAQICQHHDFDKKWMRARDIHELRDILLLAERRRFEMIG